MVTQVYNKRWHGYEVKVNGKVVWTGKDCVEAFRVRANLERKERGMPLIFPEQKMPIF